MHDKLKGLAQRLDGLATRFQLQGQFAAADDVRRVAAELKAMADPTPVPAAKRA